MDHLTYCASTMCGMKSKIPIESFRNATEAGTILLDIVDTLGRWRTEGCDRLWPNQLWPTFLATEFGQTGKNRLRPKPSLAKPSLAKSSLICVVLCVVLCCVLSEWRGYLFHGIRMGFCVWVLVSTALPGTVLPGTALPLDRPSPWTAQNLLFFPSPAAKFTLSSLSGGLLVVYWCFCERPGPSNVHVWAVGPLGLHMTTRELQPCTFERPGASNTIKIPREDPQRGWREREKKARTHPSGPHPFWVWAPTLGAPTLRAPTGFGLLACMKKPNN